ncbi:MAG TPA: hypothetical protein VGE50_12850 [Gammaproteobacteria bacterium]
MQRALHLFVWLLLACGGVEAEAQLGLAVRDEVAQLNDDSLFAAAEPYPGIAHRTLGEELFSRYSAGGVVVEWAATHQAAEGASSNQGRLNELYLDFAGAGLDFTMGKKVMSFGVGYGFRPLDVIQQEVRRPLLRTRLEGVPVAVVEQLDGDSSLAAIYVNRLEIDSDGVRRGHHEGVLRHYRFWGDLESHALLHLDETLGAAPGAGFSWVAGERLELHGSFLYMARYLLPVHTLLGSGELLATSDPWRLEERHGGSKVVLGSSATFGSLTLLGEAWHDDEALRAAQWRALFELAAAQRALLGTVPAAAVYANLAWDQRAYQHPSALPDNLLLHLGYDGQRSDPYLDWLTTPEDGGQVVTLGLDQELRQWLKLRVGVRRFGGPIDSAYGQMPQHHVAFLELNGEMVW